MFEVPSEETRAFDEIAEASLRLGREAAAETTGARVLLGGLWNALGKVLPQLYVLIQSVVAARFLGVNGMGQQSYISFVAITIGSVFGFGLSGALVRSVGEAIGRGQAGALRGLLGWGWRIVIFGAVLGGVVTMLFAIPQPELRNAWLFAAIGCSASVLITVPNAVLGGLQRWRELSIITLVLGGVTTAATVAVLVAGGGLVGMFAVNTVGIVVTLIWTAVLGRRALGQLGPGGSESSADLRRTTVKFAAVVWLSFVLSLVVWRRSEFFFLEHYSSDAQIAVYSIAYAMVTALLSALEAIAVVVAPAVAMIEGAGASHRIRSGLGRGMRLLLFVSLPITAGAIAVGPEAIVAVYGEAYKDASAPLVIMLVIFPLIPLWMLATATLWGLGRVKFWLFTCVLASVVNFGLDFALIPTMGAKGAALANMGAQVAAGIPLVIYASRVLGPISWHPAVMLRAAGAAAGAGIAGWLGVQGLGGLGGVLVGTVLGTGVFVVLGTVLKILTADDAEWLDESIGSTGRGLAGRLIKQWAAPPEPATST